jgi:CMP-N,N'-diacetyllegionaminic acid synthase
MTTIGRIDTHGGSKYITGKNIKPLAGKPRIAWTIEAARSNEELSWIIVFIENEEIGKVVHQCGAEVTFIRPPKLARDN